MFEPLLGLRRADQTARAAADDVGGLIGVLRTYSILLGLLAFAHGG